MGIQQSTTVGIKVVADVKDAQVDAEKLHNTFAATAKIAGNIRPASQTYAASAAKPTGGMVDPGLNRGASGAGGGAAASDFARQAQGLGGLVHVYATFAANLFAVSAAFTALSKAADMTNMIQGMNQLGAASGQALGSLAKRLADTTDGAVSLKQAMEATAQATSGGLSGDQLLRLTAVAKNASQALGRDMGDALSRLSKGVVKIEPELLDELGIMVRVDTAAQNYARTLGKTANSLTDFEKRQSFAIAVIEQGEQKFNSIKLDANPYNKLLASMTNLALAGGELINKVLGPIAKMLSESPIALATVMGLIATKLLTQAIPALMQYKTAMFETAIAQNATAKAASALAQEFDSSGKMAKGFAAAAPFKKVADEAQQSAITTISQLRSQVLAQQAVKEGFVLNAATRQKWFEAQQGYENKALEWDAKKAEAVEKGETKQLGYFNAKIKRFEAEAAKAREAVAFADISIAKTIEATKALDAHHTAADTPAKRWTVGGSLDANADNAAKSFAKLAVSAAVVNDVKLGGLKYALDQLHKNVAATTIQLVNAKGEMQSFDKVPLTNLHKGLAITSGYVKAIGTSVMTVIGSLGNYMMAFGVAVAAFGILDSIFSTNKKQAEAFTNSFEAVGSAVKGVEATLKLIEGKSPLGQISPESINARANALNEVSTSGKKLVDDFIDLNKHWNIWTASVDGFKGIWGGSSKAKFAESFSQGIRAAIDASNEGEAKKAAISKLNTVLNIDYTKIDSSKLSEVLENAVSNLKSDKARREAADIIKELSDNQNNQNSALQAGLQSLTQATKEYDTLIGSLNPTDGLTKLALSTVKGIDDIRKSIIDGNSALTAYAAVAGDLSKLKLFPVEDALHILQANKQIDEQNKKLIEQKNVLKDLEEKKRQIGTGGGRYMDQSINAQKQIIADSEKSFKALGDKLADIMTTSLERASKEGLIAIDRELTRSQEKAKIAVGRAQIAGVQTTGAIDQELAYKKREIDLGLEDLKAKATLAIGQEKLRLAIEQNSIAVQLSTQANAKVRDDNLINRLNTSKVKTDKAMEVLEGVGSFKELDAALAKLPAHLVEGVKGSMITLLAQQSGYKSAQATATAQKQVAEIQAGVQKVDIVAAKKEQDIGVAKNLLQLQLDHNKALISYSLVYDEILFKEKLELESKIQGKEVALLNLKIIQAEDHAKALGGKEGEIEAKQKVKILNAQKAYLINKGELDAVASIVQARKAQHDTEDKIYNDALKLSDLRSSAQSAYLTNQGTLLDLYKSEGIISDENFNKEKAILDLKLQELNYAKAAATIEREKSLAIRDKTDQATAKIQVIESSADSVRTDEQKKIDIMAVNEELTKQKKIIEDVYAASVSGLTNEDKYKKESIKATAEVNEALRVQKSLVEELTAVFGDFGKSIGETFVAYSNGLKAQELADKKYAAEKANLQSAEDFGIDVIKEKAALEAKYQQDTKKRDIDTTTSMVSSAKKLFNEKSTAYKVLDTMEKVGHMAKLAYAAIEFGTKVGWWAAETAALGAKETAQAGMKIPGVIMEFMKWMGPWGAAAAAVAIAAVLGGSGGGASAPAFVPTSQNLQETQGTGQSWDANGNKYDNGGGVFGDSSAKSKSIENSITILKDNSIVGMDYDKRMLHAMERVADAVDVAGTTLFAIKGLTSGVGLGATPGVSKESGFLGFDFLGGSSSSTAIIDAGMTIQGTVKQLIDMTGRIQKYTTTQTTTTDSGFLGFGGGTDVSTGTAYADISSEAAKSIGDVFASARDMFGTVATLAGKSATETTAAFEAMDININASLQGMSGADVTATIGSLINAQLDTLSSTMFAAFKKYRQIGEGMLETVARVIDGNSKLDAALRLTGNTFDVTKDIVTKSMQQVTETIVDTAAIPAVMGVVGSTWKANAGLEGEWWTGFFEETVGVIKEGTAAVTHTVTSMKEVTTTMSKYDLSEALIKLAGGLSNFVDQANFFTDNFMTKAQKMAIVKPQVESALTKAITDSGTSAAIPKTREEFAKLVQGINLSTEAGRQFYQSLMEIAPGFASVTDAINETSDAISILKEITDATAETLNSIVELGMTSYDKALAKISKQAQKWADQLAEAGEATVANILVIATWTVAQTALLNATNKITADKTISGLVKEISQLNFTPMQKTVAGLDDKTNDYIKSLQDLGQATDANIKSVNDWNTAMKQNEATKITTSLTKELNDLGLTPLAKTLRDIDIKAADYKDSLKLLGYATDDNINLVNEWNRVMTGMAIAKDAVTAMQKIVGIMNQIAALKTSLGANMQGIVNSMKGYNKMTGMLGTDDIGKGGLNKIGTDLWDSVDAGSITARLKNASDLQTNIMDRYNAEQEMRQKDYDTALAKAQKDEDDRVSRQNKANQDQATALTAQSQLSNQMFNALKALKAYAVGLTLLFTDPKTSVSILKAKYDATLRSANVGTLEQRMAAMGDLQNSAQTYLDAAKGQSRTALEYAIKVAEVQTGLNALADTENQYDAVAHTYAAEEETSQWQNIQTSMQEKFDSDTLEIQKKYVTELAKLQKKTDEWNKEQQVKLDEQITTMLDQALNIELIKDYIKDLPENLAASILSAAGSNPGGYGSGAAGFNSSDTGTKQYTSAADQARHDREYNDPIWWSSWHVGEGKYNGFAAGGDHPGGLRMVGEQGPELEATGPARIFSHSSTAKMLGQANVDLIKEIQELRKLVAEQQNSINSIVANTKSTKDTLIRVTRDGVGMQIAAGSEIPVTLLA